MREMDIFGTAFDCDCGRRHAIEPSEVIYSNDAFERLPGMLQRIEPARALTVLCDARTYEAAGRAAMQSLSSAGYTAHLVIVPDPPGGGSPICDDATHAALQSQLGDAPIYLSAGSGVVTDLVKWHAAERQKPFVAFATAASMNGYASPNIAATIDGVKCLMDGRCAQGIVSSPAVLVAAPYEMTASGLGDVLAKSVSAADWRLNNFLFGDYYCQRAVELIARIEPLYLANPQGILRREPKAMEALFQALLLTGAGMTMAGSSSPASGGEHLISHTLDMLSSVDGVPHDLHGRQVGVSTIVASALYRRILQVESPRFVTEASAVDRTYWGPLVREVESAYGKKNERMAEARSVLSADGKWDEMRAAVAPMLRAPELLRTCLREASAAYRLEDIGCSHERYLGAFTHARDIRARFTVLDLAHLVGIIPDAAQETLVEAFGE